MNTGAIAIHTRALLTNSWHPACLAHPLLMALGHASSLSPGPFAITDFDKETKGPPSEELETGETG